MKLLQVLALLLLGMVSSHKMNRGPPDPKASGAEEVGVTRDEPGAEEEDGETSPGPGGPGAGDECPRDEDVIPITVGREVNTSSFLLIIKPHNFDEAQRVCQKCVKGQLVSVHNFTFNERLEFSARGLNHNLIWIGGKARGLGLLGKFRWVDGTPWDFSFWAAGQPTIFGGRCLALNSQGGHWRRVFCCRKSPFFCSL
ncbi:bone marrow proteoglycan-like [Ornithorhynchus anatinus]|uniref:C-type lectin domain-containing protein n=1 Tax=Ornithorhynchus anatinus TaxID=9258 RepID=F7DJB9_ORNAN|nr:bone marrow proteoglycan-like [Ornithorhynchus anatinus]